MLFLRRVGDLGAGPPGFERHLEHLEDIFGRLDAFGAAMEVGAEKPEGQVGLRGQDEDERGRSKGKMTTEQTKADCHRHQCNGDGGQEFQDEGGEKGNPECGHASPFDIGR